MVCFQWSRCQDRAVRNKQRKLAFQLYQTWFRTVRSWRCLVRCRRRPNSSRMVFHQTMGAWKLSRLLRRTALFAKQTDIQLTPKMEMATAQFLPVGVPFFLSLILAFFGIAFCIECQTARCHLGLLIFAQLKDRHAEINTHHLVANELEFRYWKWGAPGEWVDRIEFCYVYSKVVVIPTRFALWILCLFDLAFDG